MQKKFVVLNGNGHAYTGRKSAGLYGSDFCTTADISTLAKFYSKDELQTCPAYTGENGFEFPFVNTKGI